MNKLISKISWGMVIRMFADALMLQIALVVSLLARFLYFLRVQGFSTQENAAAIKFNQYLFSAYLDSCWILLLVAIPIFYLMGFYTYGKYYQGKYRVFIIFQSVTQSFLVFGFIIYASESIFMPRSVMLLTWFLSLSMITGSRVWSWIWETVIRSEKQITIQERYRKQRSILVIGGAGYIGSSLLKDLLDKGHSVRVLDMLLFGTEPIAEVMNHPNLELIKGDFRHIDVVLKSLQGMDSVVHLGAIVGDPACNIDEELTIDINLSATRMIGELAKSAGVSRFIFASTCSVYGACDEILDERSKVEPLSLYGQTKLASEQLLLDMADDQFKPTIVRFATIYGLSGRTRFDLVVNLLTAKAKIEGKITVFGGEQWRPFVHVNDAALGVSMLLESPKQLIANQVFNVGSNDQNYTINQIAQLVQEHVIGADLEVDEDQSDKRNYRVKFNKIRNKIGFKPQWTVESGIQQVLHAISNGEIEDYLASKYSNAKFLSDSNAELHSRDNWEHELIQTIQEK